MTKTSPIPLEKFRDSVQDRNNARFFPSDAYTSDEFYHFERDAVWFREWISVGRLEEIPERGDFFTVNICNEPIIVVRARDGLKAMSAVCQHRGMVLTDQAKGNAKGFVCPYHRWTYDLEGKLVGAPQMDGVGTFDKDCLGLPRLAVEVWQGIIFINFDTGAAPLADRLAPLEAIVESWSLPELRGEFLMDPNYHQAHDYDWNWKVYAEGQAECYHCDKLHAEIPGIQNIDCSSMEMKVQDEQRGVFAFEMRSKVIDATINHVGTSIWPPIPTLSEAQRWEQHSIVIAPNIFMQLMPDCVILLSWWPTGPRTMRVKRHRLYPQSTLDRADFAEQHKLESDHIRYFVGQDDYAFAAVQKGLSSRYAPHGPLSHREFVINGMSKWLVERYERADAQARAHMSDELATAT
ncbi:aromatic ring-hydroxylating dioxygenase subunit alpha [Sphingorhabdus sp.]|jgi:phenylpropionate dioxygenase-like ring-hydroxylating dioxygenase large terminal subunit|uniref:aromatic ring-hydroxylating dioxygenase subunit alpha n=1 Tax=Sphingorhabdus sp. TaxID=1902408 RepID=UPI0037C7189A